MTINNILKTILMIGIIVVISSTLIGCSEAQLKVIASDKIAKENCEAILNSLDTGDKEGLKNLFCNKVKSSAELDTQIDAAMEFYDGKTVSYDTILGAGSGSNRNGKIVRKTNNPNIIDIVTDTNKKYDIKFYMYIVCSEDEDKVGISEISIKSDEGKECIIGSWIE